MLTDLDPTSFDVNALVQRNDDSIFKPEYNCMVRRLIPWIGKVNTKRQITEFGIVHASIEPRTKADEHRHDEEECFYILCGEALLSIEGEVVSLKKGDLVYVPRNWLHRMENPSGHRLDFLDIYWDLKEG